MMPHATPWNHATIVVVVATAAVDVVADDDDYDDDDDDDDRMSFIPLHLLADRFVIALEVQH